MKLCSMGEHVYLAMKVFALLGIVASTVIGGILVGASLLELKRMISRFGI